MEVAMIEMTLNRVPVVLIAISVARRMRSKLELGLSSCNLRAFLNGISSVFGMFGEALKV